VLQIFLIICLAQAAQAVYAIFVIYKKKNLSVANITRKYFFFYKNKIFYVANLSTAEPSDTNRKLIATATIIKFTWLATLINELV
jgi:hypothetical protein